MLFRSEEPRPLRLASRRAPSSLHTTTTIHHHPPPTTHHSPLAAGRRRRRPPALTQPATATAPTSTSDTTRSLPRPSPPTEPRPPAMSQTPALPDAAGAAAPPVSTPSPGLLKWAARRAFLACAALRCRLAGLVHGRSQGPLRALAARGRCPGCRVPSACIAMAPCGTSGHPWYMHRYIPAVAAARGSSG